jgi:hypothetical protein
MVAESLPSEKLIEDEILPFQNSVQISHEQTIHSTAQRRQSEIPATYSKIPQELPIQLDLSSEDQSVSLKEPLQIQAINTPTQGTSLASIIPRNIFTDGLNSFWHFVIGMFAVKFPILVSLFIFYQILDRYDINICIDILEFILGFTITYFFLKI